MFPIATLSPAAASNLLGVCFDIDDTVTTHGTLDPSAYAALFELKRVGLTLIAVTGRPLGFAEVVARTWPVDAAVGENGAGYFAREHKRLRTGYWDSPEERATQQRKLAAIRALVAREMPQVTVTNDSWARRCDLAFDVAEYESLSRAEIEQLVSLIKGEGAQALVSSVHAHAQLGDHDKARGVARALHELRGLEPDQVQQRFLFVGDSGNDAAAFAWFDWTAGVANVRNFLDRLPRPPRFVSEAECGAGFAEIAQILLAGRSARP